MEDDSLPMVEVTVSVIEVTSADEIISDEIALSVELVDEEELK